MSIFNDFNVSVFRARHFMNEIVHAPYQTLFSCYSSTTNY